MRIKIYKYHNAGKLFRADDAGTNLSDLLSDDDLGGGTGKDSVETEEQRLAKIAAQQATDDAEKLKQQEAQQKLELAKELGGTKFNDAGDVVDDAGKVIKTAQEIQDLAKPKAIEIDGVEYQINDKGDAIDKDGKVIKTKTEIDAIIDEQNNVPLVEELKQKSGYNILDEDGKPKVYEDSIEGIIELANDIAEVKSRTSQQKFFERFPQVEKFVDFLAKGGNEKDYFNKQSSSWLNVKLDENDENQLHNIIVADLISKGMDKEQADFTAKTYKDTGKLKDFGKIAFTRLQEGEKEIAKKEDLAYKQRVKDEEDKQTAHWNNVNEVVKKGKLGNIVIPEADRVAFFEYIAKDADGKGNSKAILDLNKLPIETQLQLDYYQFKGFDLSKLIQNQSATQQAKGLRERIKIHTGLGGGKGIDKGKFSKPNYDADISMDNFDGVKK